VKITSSARLVASFVAALSLVLTGLLGNPAVAGDDRGLGAPPKDRPSAGQVAAASETWVNRMHATANNERVDLRDDRIDKVWNLHKVNFTALVRVVEWARSPRMKTSPDGIDRGVYRYRIYEYEYVNGDLQKTGRWVVLQTIIEWGDGMADRGWMVTTYPVSTQAGAPPKDAAGKTYCPAWLANTAVMGPVNNDILY
jgi:hypothetical protein